MAELFKNKYRIESTRLPDYDYSQSGYYFITICTQNRINYFGNVINGKMMLNDTGKIAVDCWMQIPQHFTQVTLDEFVIMPNHVHGVIFLNDFTHGCRDVACNVSTNNEYNTITNDQNLPISNFMSKISPKTGSISTIIRSFKSAATKQINEKYGNHHFTWQPRFYNHVIRNEISLYNIQQYIINNPIMWHRDRNNEPGLTM